MYPVCHRALLAGAAVTPAVKVVRFVIFGPVSAAGRHCELAAGAYQAAG